MTTWGIFSPVVPCEAAGLFALHCCEMMLCFFYTCNLDPYEASVDSPRLQHTTLALFPRRRFNGSSEELSTQCFCTLCAWCVRAFVPTNRLDSGISLRTPRQQFERWLSRMSRLRRICWVDINKFTCMVSTVGAGCMLWRSAIAELTKRGHGTAKRAEKMCERMVAIICML